MTMITPSYLGETIEYSSLHACRSTLEDPTWEIARGQSTALNYGGSGTCLQDWGRETFFPSIGPTGSPRPAEWTRFHFRSNGRPVNTTAREDRVSNPGNSGCTVTENLVAPDRI